MIAELLGRYLTKKGVSAEALSNPAKVKRRIQSRKFDLIFLDYRMRPFTGKDILEWLNFNYPDIPVVMMSAYCSQEGRNEIQNMGAISYLEKPLDLEKIDQICESILKQG